MAEADDPVAEFYERHPYPPPMPGFDGYAPAWTDGALHLMVSAEYGRVGAGPSGPVLG